MQNLPSNWLHVALPDACVFLGVFLMLTCGMACGNEKRHVISVYRLFTLQHVFVGRGVIYIAVWLVTPHAHTVCRIECNV